MKNEAFPWLRFSMEMATLGVEAQSVVSLRMMRLAAGGSAAERETIRMVGEKLAAFAESQLALLNGVVSGSAHRPPVKAVAPYLRRVRANQRRLTQR